MSARFTHLIPFIFAWLWSTGFINARYALPYIEPFYFLTLRFALTVLAFLVLVLILRKRWPTRKQIFWQLIVGILLHGGYLGSVFFGIHLGMPAGVTSIFVGLHPVVTAILGWAILNQAINLRQSIGLVVGFSGLLLVILGSSSIDGSELKMASIIAGLMSLAGMSFGGMAQKLAGENVPLMSGTLWQYLGGFLVILPLSLMLETQEVVASFEMIAALVWSVFALSVGAILLLFYMIRHGEVAKVASYFYLVPPLTVLQGWMLFDETLGLIALSGCFLAVIGVYMVARVK